MPIQGQSPINKQGNSGRISKLDGIKQGDPVVASVLGDFGDYVDTNRSSQRWAWCYPARTKVVLPDGTSRNIEDIKEGDTVQSFNGPTKVVKTATFQYESLSKLYSYGNLPISSTEDHKYLVIRKNNIKSKRRIRKMINGKRVEVGDNEFPVDCNLIQKVSLKDINKEDYIVIGFKRDRSKNSKLVLRDYISEPEYYGRNRNILPEVVELTPELLEVFGLYLGDGTANFKNGSVKFTFGLHEKELALKVKEVFETTFGISVSIVYESNVIRVCTFSRSLVELFIGLLGGGINNPKKIV